MKLWKHSLITAFAFFGISTTVLYTSCEKDSCNDLVCRNGGSCAEGFCRCPTGYEGTECESMAADKFVGSFVGNVQCGEQTPLSDTVDIWIAKDPNEVRFVQHSRPSDTLQAIANGNSLTVQVHYDGNYKRAINISIDNKKLTYYREDVPDTSNAGGKNVCYFIGFKK